jgi:predicted nucleic acid-binding protein
MSGNKYLLDTNFFLGILKSNPLVLAELSSRRLFAGECSYSAVTRMELLGFHSITREEESLIVQKLEHLTYLPLTRDIEDKVIELRQLRKIKLPDAIIAATALCSGIDLLTLDRHLSGGNALS